MNWLSRRNLKLRGLGSDPHEKAELIDGKHWSVGGRLGRKPSKLGGSDKLYFKGLERLDRRPGFGFLEAGEEAVVGLR